jgi:DNA-binding NarL/FixJ family response regulator
VTVTDLETSEERPVGQIDVLIADDHPVYRSGLRALLDLAPMLNVVGEVRTGREALSMTYQLRPHLVLMDINLPEMSGIEATKTIATRCPDTAVIIVTMMEDRDTFLAAIRAGARGYLLKGSGLKDVCRAIETVRCGGLHFDHQVGNWVLEHLVKPAATGVPFPELTDRERAVLELVADGRGNAYIARELGLSIKTVRNYLSRIFAKLQLVDRTEAAVRARRAGLGH